MQLAACKLSAHTALTLSQAVANSLWAYATLSYDPGPDVLNLAGQRILACVDSFRPHVSLCVVCTVLVTSRPEG